MCLVWLRLLTHPNMLTSRGHVRCDLATDNVTYALPTADGTLTVRAAGHGYLPDEAVELDTCWRGRPRPGRHPLYTSYVLTQVVTAGRDGILDVVVTIPVRPDDYSSYTLRTLARDHRIGFRLAAATRRG